MSTWNAVNGAPKSSDIYSPKCRFSLPHPYLCGKFQERYDARTTQILIGSGF